MYDPTNYYFFLCIYQGGAIFTGFKDLGFKGRLEFQKNSEAMKLL